MPLNELEAFAALAPDPGDRVWSLSFTEFVAELGVTLTPGQYALAAVAYDGLQPIELPPEYREIARQIFGPVDIIPPEARHVVCVVAGARGGKSYVIAALRILHLALTVSLAPLAPGEEAFGVIIAPDPRQRAQCYAYALGAAQKHPGIGRMIVGQPGKHLFRLRRPDGVVCIESVPAKRGGSAGRGRSLVGAALEEAAFFLDANYVVNDEEVFRAVAPRVLPGGQTIISSTPWAEAGLLYKEFVANHPAPRCAAPHLAQAGHPHRAIAAHAPTLLLRDMPDTRDYVVNEQKRDPVNAAREHGAQFLSLGTAQFFDPVRIAEAVDQSLTIGMQPSGHPQAIRAVGADLGFVHDAATDVVVERTTETYTLLTYSERLPGVERLKPSQVFGSIAADAETYNVEEVVGDQHYAEAAKEAFWGRGLVFIEVPGGQVGKAVIFNAAAHQLNEGRCRIPNDPRLLEQLRAVKKRPLPGGGMAIEQPRTKEGGHGDVVSAWVAAVWRLSRLTLPEAPRVLPDDPRDREAVLWQERVNEKIARDAERERLAAVGLEPIDIWKRDDLW